MAKDIKQDISLGIEKREWDKPDGRLLRAVLNLDTSKGYNGGVESTATVFWLTGDGGRQHAFGLGVRGDFSRKLLAVPGICTQKKVDTQHAAVFNTEAVAALVDEVKAYYGEATAPNA